MSYLDHIRRQADILAATRQQQYQVTLILNKYNRGHFHYFLTVNAFSQTVLQDLAERESLIEWYKQVYPYERPPHINSVVSTTLNLLESVLHNVVCAPVQNGNSTGIS